MERYSLPPWGRVRVGDRSFDSSRPPGGAGQLSDSCPHPNPPPRTRDANSLPLGGGGLGWGGRGVDARPIAWTDAGSLLQPDSGSPSAAFLKRHPHPDPPPSRGRELMATRSANLHHASVGEGFPIQGEGARRDALGQCASRVTGFLVTG